MLICANVNGCPANQGLLSYVPVWDPDNLIWVVTKDIQTVATVVDTVNKFAGATVQENDNSW